METRDEKMGENTEAVHSSKRLLYGMDPTTTLFTFLL